MKKIELINEIKNVVMNNGGEVKHGQIRYFINENGDVMADYSTGRGKNINSVSKAQLENDLAVVKMFVEKYYNTEVETVEAEVENNTEEVSEPKATKKDIIMGLYKDGSVECDLATAEELAQEGFIEIEDYEDGVLYGNLSYTIIGELIESGVYVGYIIDKYGGFNHSELDIVMNMFDHGYVSSIEYEGKGNWLAELNWDNILTDFCKRWDNKLNEAA